MRQAAGYQAEEASARRVASYFLRPVRDEDGEIRSNNDLAAFLIRRRRSFIATSTTSLFKPLDSSWLLPPRQNGLWASFPHDIKHLAPLS